MHCTDCGSAISASAKFCGGCGRKVAPAATAPAATNPLQSMGGCGFLILVIGVLWAASQLFGGKDPPKAAAAPLSAAEMQLRAKHCEEALAALTSAGVILERPSSDRISVNELAWAMLPAKEKRAAVWSVRCSSLGGADGTVTDFGYVDGYRSGKLLASASSAGPSIED